MSEDMFQNQIYLYSLETKDFYTDDEKIISDKYMKSLRIKNRIKNKRYRNLQEIDFLENQDCLTVYGNEILESRHKKNDMYDYHMKMINQTVNYYNEQINTLLDNNKNIREIRKDALQSNKIISLFESSLTRTCKMKNKEVTEDLFVVRIFHYQVLNSIIKNGFLFNNKKYEYFTSSAGQIRTKKIVCINSELYEEYKNSITCELPKEEINKKGGVNTNKYQAYLALISSASIKWERFNIDRVVVVDDMCTDVYAEVDDINIETYEITRIKKNLPIEHMDGCGIILPTVSKKSFMFRAPWMKGMVTPFDFRKFAETFGQTKIVDIYGKEYDIIDDNINIILTKSQFKMWKYYDSWSDYQEKFKKHKCEASKLNIEDIGTDATINYQMLQTLVGMTEDELQKIANNSIEDIKNLGSDKHTMLRVLGATKENKNKNSFQKALLLYPELLTDAHSRETIKSKKKKLIKDARSGKLRVNGKYTFIIPDIYAFCQWLFLNEKNPIGLLENNEVYCNIFDEGELDVLRAPHLYKEHAIRKNIKKQNLKDWFITKGIYISVHDPISRILQCDFDGDKALVIQDNTLIKVAQREMDGIVPLYYEMAKAKDTLITSEKIYESLTSAYKANIGIISNDITKIWNSDNPDIRAVKWLTMYNNFIIDYAKTLFKPTPPDYAEEIIKSFTKSKVPHFFIYVKDKEEKLVENINESTVNKLQHIIVDRPIRFKNVAGTVDYKKLMNNPKVKNSEDIVERFIELSRAKHFWLSEHDTSGDFHFNEMVREEMLKISKRPQYIADVLTRFFYSNNSRFKDSLWDVYGELLYSNLEKNLKDTIQCELCTTRVVKINKSTKYCENCKVKIKKEQDRIADLKYKQKKREI